MASLASSSSRLWSRITALAGPSRQRAYHSAPGATLGDLAPVKGSTKDAIRYGRGQGSTKGGTAGRGHKGQKARSGNGKPTPGFEGGQTPMHRLVPKRGFVNFTARTYAPLPLARLQSSLLSGLIDPSTPITIGTIIRSNLIHGISGFSGVKLLGPHDPSLPLPPLDLQLSRFSKSAAEAVVGAGGKVLAVYKNRLALRKEVWPEKVDGVDAKPVRKADIQYYSNPKKYGYLAPGIAPASTSTESTV